MPGPLLRHFFIPSTPVFQTLRVRTIETSKLWFAPLLKYVKNEHLALLISIFEKQMGLNNLFLFFSPGYETYS